LREVGDGVSCRRRERSICSSGTVWTHKAAEFVALPGREEPMKEILTHPARLRISCLTLDIMEGVTGEEGGCRTYNPLFW
jgi:hypothetical protein